MSLPNPRKIRAVITTLACLTGVAQAGTVRIDFGRNNGADGNPTTSPDVYGNYWNNVVGDGGVAPGILASNLVTSDNTPTTLGVRVHSEWSANGIQTGGLLNPDQALLGDAAVDTATQDYFFIDGSKKGSMTITGLDPELLYTFRIFATRETDQVRETTYTLTTGSGVSSTNLQTSGPGIGDDGIYNGNDDAFAEFVDIQADASGQAIIDVSIAQGGFAYIGLMEIIEGDAVPALVPETNSGRVLIDFGRTNGADGNITMSPDINGNWWNNFAAPNPIPNLLKIEKLFTSDHAPTDIDITVGSNWQSNGIQNGGLLAPNPTLLGDLAIGTVTEDYIFLGQVGAVAPIEISGLNPAKTYTFRVFGTRVIDQTRETIYTISDANGSTSQTLQTSGLDIGEDGLYDGNDNTIIEFTGVQSTTSTKVKLELTAVTGGFAYIGALEIIETGDASVIEPPVSATGIVRIDFGRSDGIGANGRATASPDAYGNWWNNMLGFGGVPNGLALYDLVTTDNAPTTIDVMTNSGNWESNGRNNGGLKAPDGPDPALLEDFAIESATEDYFFRGGGIGDTSSLLISGLNPEKKYNFRMFATRNTGDLRETTYTITGSGAPASVSLQTSGDGSGTNGYQGNNNTIAEISDISPNSSGSVSFDMTISQGAFAYLAILDIVEVQEAPFQVTAISVTEPDTVSLTFNSKSGNLYDIQSNLDLGAFGSIGQIVASGPTTTFTRTGMSLVDREFFRVEDLGEAPPLFSEDFETGDGGFTTEDKSDGGTGSDWQSGDPDSVGFDANVISTGAGGSTNCWGIDIGNPGYVSVDTATCLRSSVIDLTGITNATLSFAQAMDFEPNDLAEVWVIEAGTNNVIEGPIHTSADADITSSTWNPVGPISLPAAALGQQIRLEWRFTKVDPGSDYLGWYIDDVTVNQ